MGLCRYSVAVAGGRMALPGVEPDLHLLWVRFLFGELGTAYL